MNEQIKRWTLKQTGATLLGDKNGEWVSYTDHIEALSQRPADPAWISASELEEQWKTRGVIEIAVRNPNVASYMEHWESRALKAEARVKKLEELLKIAADAIELMPGGRSVMKRVTSEIRTMLTEYRQERRTALASPVPKEKK